MPKKKNELPDVPHDITSKDRISRAVMVALVQENFNVALLQGGEIAISMPDSDYTIKVTKKKERII